MRKRLTTEEFIEHSKAVHGDKYGYDKVDYQKNNIKVIIACPEHGDFSQVPNNHLNGQGCYICGLKASADYKRTTKEEFIEQARAIHGNRYVYDKVDYKTALIKVIITCPEHKDFSQTPNHHLRGQGCEKCGFKASADDKRTTKEEFIEQARAVHSGKYGYDKVDYKTARIKVIITCPEHGDFSQTPGSHLSGKGCKLCAVKANADNRRTTKEEFIEKARAVHGDNYDYDKVDYEHNHSKVIITCPEHGDFSQTPGSHLSGNGCNRCYNKSEGKIAIYLNLHHIVHRQFGIENRYFDFYLPDYNLIIERDGEQHYPIIWSRPSGQIFSKREGSSYKTSHQNDIYKTQLAKKNGYKIARIPYWLEDTEVELEIENILAGYPTYPDVPDPRQEETKPTPEQTLKN